MDHRAVLAFTVGLLVGGAPLAAYGYALNRQLSGLENELGLRDQQLAGLQGQVDSLNETVTGLQEDVARLQEEIEAFSTQAEATLGPAKLTLRLDKTIFQLGESVKLSLTITNISNDTITLSFRSPPELDFAVCTESSQIIYSFAGTHGFIGILVGMVLKPEESFGQIFSWDQKVLNETDGSSEQVKPGIYFIFGRTGPGLYQIKPCEQEITKIETPKIQIKIISENSS